MQPRRVSVIIYLVLTLLTLGPLAVASDELPTINNIFIDTYITEALQSIAFEAGVNILSDVTVEGYVNLELNDVPFLQALELILTPGGYTYKALDATTYLVGRATPGSPMAHLLGTTSRYKFQHIDAESARRLVPSEYNSFVKFDAASGAAVVTGSPSMVERIMADLRVMDVPPQQVVIEALITEISLDAADSLGIDWSWLSGNSPILEPNRVEFTNLVGTISYVTASGWDRFRSTLKALVNDGKAVIRANPRIAVLDGKEASIFIGNQRYYQIMSGSNENPFVRLESIDAGVSLKVRPQVAENGEITVHIEPEVSDVVNIAASDGLPQINRRNAVTTVRVKEGQTISIGGLFQRTQSQVVSKVPILGDLPILANLFRNTTTVEQETEVMVFITPHLMSDEEVTADDID